MKNLSYNKVCHIEDFSNPIISSIIKDVFVDALDEFSVESEEGIPELKQWETAMSIRTLSDFGMLNRDSTILGVGAGTGVTNFYLTKYVKQVFATDLYLDAGVWAETPPFLMLVNPEKFSPMD